MPRTVLLADDSVTAQNMGRRILTDAGYEVITVNNGSAALKKIHEVRPDLIVLDVYMPGYGGLEVCQRLKESGDTMKIPVLLTVGKMEPFKADEAKRVRADAHIVKPFDASELLAALAKLEDRIVPQAEPARGRKSKKPSFWHDDDSSARAASEAPNAVANTERARSEEPELSAEAVGAQTPEPAQNIGAFPLVREATEELPVIADSNVSVSADEGAAPAQPSEELPSAAVPESNAELCSQESLPPQEEGVPESSAEAEISKADSSTDAASATSPTVRWVAENVALSPEEAAVQLEQEMRAAEGTVSEPELAPATQPAETQGATFAAAAGAEGATLTSAVAKEESEAAPTSEAVAAWQNWQQIRETVMNAHSTAAIAESVAQVAKAGIPGAQSGEPKAAQDSPMKPSVPDNPDSAELEAGALASIVDTVLAELKPKLMEEIAKKLKK